MAGEEHGHATRRQAPNRLAQIGDADGVQAVGRLVQDHQIRFARDGGGKRETLAHASGEQLERPAITRIEASHFYCRDQLRRRHPVEPSGAERDEIVQAREVRVKAGLVDDGADPPEIDLPRCTRCPRMSISPDVDAINPRSIRMVVVFPAPFGPTNP